MSQQDEAMAGWARHVAQKGATLLHVPTFVVGKAIKAYGAGEFHRAGEFPVSAPVVELDTGHALVANPNAFVELDENAAEFHRLVGKRMAMFVTGAVQEGAARNVPATTAVALVSCVVRAQAGALRVPT